MDDVLTAMDEVKADDGGDGMYLYNGHFKDNAVKYFFHSTDLGPTDDVKVQHIVDFNLLREIESGDHCRGKGGYCKGLERVITNF